MFVGRRRGAIPFQSGTRSTGPRIGNLGSGEIEGVSSPIHDDFDDVRIRKVGRVPKWSAKSTHQERFVVVERLEYSIDVARLDERFVTLNVDNKGAVEFVGNFSHPIQAAAMVGGRHTRLTAECCDCVCDTSIVGRHQDSADARRRRGTAVHMFNHGPSVDVGERLARESGGVESGGDDGDRVLCPGSYSERIGVRNRVHDE